MAVLRLHPGKQEALRAGRPWVYRGEIAEVVGSPVTGDVVRVADARGRFLASAFYHERSVLAARLLSRREDEPIDEAFLRRRLQAACELRAGLLDDPTVCRLVFAEADGLPGVVADRFGPVIVLQTLVAGMDARLDVLAAALMELTGADGVYERNLGPVRRLEGLPQRQGPVLGAPPETVEIAEGAVRMAVDVRSGQKTGHFLDQRENRLAFGRLIRRLLVQGARTAAPVQVLDAFCHTGGFGLQALAAGADDVLFLDSSATAVEAALENALLNPAPGRAEGRVGNAFDELRALERTERRWDAVVLDPPAFARGRAQLDAAYRGYKELNLRAMRILRPGGLLCSCTCSEPVTEDMFEEMLRDAAADAGRRMRVLERRGAAADHPGLLGASETHYLRCHLLQAVED